jgi:hypothetical protein
MLGKEPEDHFAARLCTSYHSPACAGTSHPSPACTGTSHHSPACTGSSHHSPACTGTSHHSPGRPGTSPDYSSVLCCRVTVPATVHIKQKSAMAASSRQFSSLVVNSGPNILPCPTVIPSSVKQPSPEILDIRCAGPLPELVSNFISVYTDFCLFPNISGSF